MKGFKSFLIEEELSENTRESYIWTMQKFSEQYSEFNKENAILFKADYVKSFSPKTVNNRISAIEKYAKDKFGEFAGIAQQYLFFYARDNLR